VCGIIITHHHHDHISAVQYLREKLAVPVLGHKKNIDLIPFALDSWLEEGDRIVSDAEEWNILHTPGHAPGHICLYSEEHQDLIAGDMVAGEGTILINPKEGSIREYLASLSRLHSMNIQQLYPAHGNPLASSVLPEYIAHRHQRLKQVLGYLSDEQQQPLDIAQKIYTDLPKQFLGIASIQVHCGLLWLAEEGLAIEEQGYWIRR